MAPEPGEVSSCASMSQISIVRCNVVLPNGKSVRVPIPEDAALAELHQAAILRGFATALEFPYTVESTALKLGGKDAAYLWDKDKISDVVDNAETHTFHLTALVDNASTSAENPSQQLPDHAGVPNIFPDVTSFSFHSEASSIVNTKIRWVLPETALTAGRTINSLPTERDTLPSTTTVAELEKMAAGKISNLQAPSELSNLSPTMFTRYSSLAHAQSKDVSIASLGLVTSVASPLTIFMVPTRTPATNVKDALGFKTSDRAWATFMTSLRLFLAKIARKSAKLHNFLEVLWELTHFPPAVISLRQMVLEKDIQPQPCAVFATCFRQICLQIVSSSVYALQDDILLTSRQVFSWLCSLRSHSSTIFKSSHAIAHAVELRTPNATSRLNTVGRSTNDENIQISELLSGSEADDQRDDQKPRQLVVCKERLDDVSSEMLAVALDENENSIIRCYFELPETFGSSFGGHKRRKLMDSKDFVDLLAAIHEDEIFRMIGPFQLTQCASVSLPIVTLDAQGYVSLYDRKDGGCGEKYTCTWNVIKEEQKLPATEPGQYLFQKLEPLMIERKKAATWQVDAWEDAKPGTFGGPPYEAIVICVDTSTSMTHPMPESWFENYAAANNGEEELSRMNEVKEFFKNFMVRLNAYRVSTDIGLVTFAGQDQVKILQPLTRVVLDLQYALDGVKTSWGTALWNGIRTSCDMLVDHKTKHPDVKLRIIALTDGENNIAGPLPADLCAEMYKQNIVLDSIVIDTDSTLDLFKMAKHTGGYAFHPQNRTALFQIFLLENFVDIRTRPDITKVAIDNYRTTKPKFADLKTMFDLPPCRPHENQDDHFIALADAALFLRRGTRRVSITPGSRGKPQSMSSESSRSAASGSTRILLDQVQDAITKRHDFIDIYVSENNMGFWKVVMAGRSGTPYESGTFLAYVEIGDDFPSKPPTMRFITPILHPNVSKHGRICHHIFDRSWDPDFSVMQVVQHVWDILVLAESADVIDPIAALRFYTDQESAKRLIKAYITRFAMKSRDRHRLEICGPESPFPSTQVSRAGSVISLPTDSSSDSWQSIGSQRDRSGTSHQLTVSALNNLEQQQANLRGPPTYCNPSHIGRARAGIPRLRARNTTPTTRTISASAGSASPPSTSRFTFHMPANSPLSQEPQVSSETVNANDASTSNTVAHPTQDQIDTSTIRPGSSPLASSATPQVSRRVSFFENFKKPSSGL